MAELTSTDVRQWISAVEAETRELQEQLAPLLERQKALEERLGILRRLLQTLDGETVANFIGEAVTNGYAHAVDNQLSVRDRVIRDAMEILKDAEGPMHINDIHAEFVKRGYEIPGAGKPVNITVHLSGAEPVASPGRGLYALKPTRSLREPVRDESRSRARG